MKFMRVAAVVLALSALMVGVYSAEVCGRDNFTWKGIQWVSKDSLTDVWGPGPNYWDKNNVCVNDEDQLVLKISNVNGLWKCGEIHSPATFQLGTYTWKTITDFTLQDKNIVTGLFQYPNYNNPDALKEFDIEFARWGQDTLPPVWYTVWPGTKTGKDYLLANGGTDYTAEGQSFQVKYDQALTGTYTTHRYSRGNGFIVYESYHGHTTDKTMRFKCVRFWYQQKPTPSKLKTKVVSAAGTITYLPDVSTKTGTSAADYLTSDAQGIYMNLWLFRGQAPSNSQPYSVTIADFTYSSTLAVTDC